MEDAYFRSNYHIGAMLRVLLNSQFFKDARFAKVKSPAETVVGTMRLAGDFTRPKPGLNAIILTIRYMGQDLLNPPTVEGWHGGSEWIDSGTLLERINFTAAQVGRTDLPGIGAIIERLNSPGPALSGERLVDHCLEMLGCYGLEPETRDRLVALAENDGELRPGTEGFPTRVAQMLQLIISTPEYLFA